MQPLPLAYVLHTAVFQDLDLICFIFDVKISRQDMIIPYMSSPTRPQKEPFAPPRTHPT